MFEWNRRNWLTSIMTAGIGAIGTGVLAQSRQTQQVAKRQRGNKPLALVDYEPKSMLHVPETKVPRSRFPGIDFHTHLSWVEDWRKNPRFRHAAKPDEILSVMDRKNVRLMVNLTGG